MTTDPNGWFLAAHALDHRDTAAAVLAALPEWLAGDEKSADSIAGQLARAGFALVRLDKAAELMHDLTAQVDASLAARTTEEPGFLARMED